MLNQRRACDKEGRAWLQVAIPTPLTHTGLTTAQPQDAFSRRGLPLCLSENHHTSQYQAQERAHKAPEHGESIALFTLGGGKVPCTHDAH